ncbi:S1/P1 nuclease [bacterium]|nr:S1/P1 nuclease [bacterium]
MRIENRGTRKVFPALALAILLAVGSAFGWSGDGHRVVADVATNHLTPEAKAGVAELLGPGVSLADVSTWADQVRRERRDTAPWHYVNYALELDEPDFDIMEQEGGNVAWAVEEMTRRVQDAELPKQEREEALKYLVHLVGDLHQPLHCGTGDDLGGNKIKVLWNGEETNLHKVWDWNIMHSRNLSREEIVEDIESKITPGGIASTQRGRPYDWMVESHKYARDFAYAGMQKYGEQTENGVDLGGRYADAMWPLTERRLAEGGLRLAMILNHLFPDFETAANAEERPDWPQGDVEIGS